MDVFIFVPVGSASPEIPVAPPIVEVCTAYAQAVCNQLKTCSAFTYSAQYATEAQCLIVYERECRVAMGAIGSGDTPAARRSCAEAIKAQSCDDRAAIGLPAACMSVRGSVSVGGSCRSSAQCVVGAYCDVSAEAVAATPGLGSGFRCGRCVPRADVGKDCNPTNNPTSCVDGASCAARGGPNVPGICVRNKAAGEACSIFDQCAVGTLCRSGTCMATQFAGLGESCSTLFCLGGDLYCDRASGLCEKNLPLAKKGEYCGGIQDGSGRFVTCAGGLACSGVAANGFANVCAERGGYGQPCGPAQTDPRCLPGMFCKMGTCVWAEPATCP